MRLQRGERVKQKGEEIDEYALIHPPEGRRKSTVNSCKSQKCRRLEGLCQEDSTNLSLERVQRGDRDTTWICKLKKVPKECEGESRIMMPF